MGDDGRYVDGSVWFYDPNKIPAIVFAALFGASGLVHAWQCYRYKCWKLTGWGVAGAAVYCGSFIARAMGAADYKNLTTYVVHFNLAYAAPPLFELLNYAVLARVAYYLPYHSPIHPGRLKTTFTALATVIEVLGGYGAYYTAKRDEPRTEQAIGRGCLAASLFLQVALLVAYLALAAVFHARARTRSPRARARPDVVLWTLYASSLLILTRTVFRLVEFFGLDAFRPFGDDGKPQPLDARAAAGVPPVVRFEWPFYVFEAAFMFCNLVLLHVAHPRRRLPESNAVYLAQDGLTELEGPGFRDDRNVLFILMDPLDFIGLIKGTNKADRFWQNNGFGELAESPSPPAAGGRRATRVRHHERRKR